MSLNLDNHPDVPLDLVHLRSARVCPQVHSQDVAKTMRASDAVKTLAAEKDELVVEKHQLTDEVNRLRKELKDSNKQWKAEQEDLRKIVAEKSKLIEDNEAISSRLQTEMNSLKSQVGYRRCKDGGSVS